MAATAANVLILSSDTGGGHQSAAQALESSLTSLTGSSDRWIRVNVTRVLEEANVITRQMANLYNFLLRHRQDLMKYYFHWVDQFRPNESRFIFQAAFRYGRQVLESVTPDVIVSVHPMTHHFFAYLLRRFGLLDKIPLVSVVTDPCYGFWRGWACQDVQRYYVASTGARQQLMEYGVPDSRIAVAGMPVHQRFRPISTEEQRALRVAYGLDPDRFTVFLNAGWVGGGNIPKIYESLLQSPPESVQAVFLAGTNQRLYREISQLSASSPCPVRVVGYTANIHELMGLSDVMISKPGGLTTFEALACGVPIIADTVTEPMPQEAHTAGFIQEAGAGILLNSPEAIVSVIQSLVNSPEQFHRMRQVAVQLGKHGAADRIALDIANTWLPNWRPVNTEAVILER
ncbi:MAG: glycosyltransferase [Candidatus Melainabacteria bacterium]|nr:glycosyltransferase [Candidatus Melainabacteria bacterium]